MAGASEPSATGSAVTTDPPAPFSPTTAMVVPGSASRVSSSKPVTSACRGRWTSGHAVRDNRHAAPTEDPVARAPEPDPVAGSAPAGRWSQGDQDRHRHDEQQDPDQREHQERDREERGQGRQGRRAGPGGAACGHGCWKPAS
nr:MULTISPECIES: hypothetical protein [unclassified Streptomyces]